MRQRKEGRERRLGEEVDELEEVVVVGTQIAVLQTEQNGRELSCSLLPPCRCRLQARRGQVAAMGALGCSHFPAVRLDIDGRDRDGSEGKDPNKHGEKKVAE